MHSALRAHWSRIVWLTILVAWTGWLPLHAQDDGKQESPIEWETPEGALQREWLLRKIAMDPEAMRAEWDALWEKGSWLDRFDALEVLARTPEGALWLSGTEIQSLRSNDLKEAAALQTVWMELNRKVQGQGVMLPFPKGTLQPGQSVGVGESDLLALLLVCEWLALQTGNDHGSGLEALMATVVDESGWIADWRWPAWGPILFSCVHLFGAEALPMVQTASGGLHVPRLQANWPNFLQTPLRAEFLGAMEKAATDAEARFTVQALRLAQHPIHPDTTGVPHEDVAKEVLAGILRWPSVSERQAIWGSQSDSVRRGFVKALVRTGQPELGSGLWRAAMQIPNGWNARDLEAFGGEDYARRDLLEWAAEALPVQDVLVQALGLPEDLSDWVLQSLVLRLPQASPSELAPWLQPDRPGGQRMQILAALGGMPESPVRMNLLRLAAADGDLELARRAFRLLAGKPKGPESWEGLFEAWNKRPVEDRLVLLRELPIGDLPEEFLAFSEAWVRELLAADGEVDPVLIRTLAAIGDRPAVRDLLWSGFEREWKGMMDPEGTDYSSASSAATQWLRSIGEEHHVDLLARLKPRFEAWIARAGEHSVLREGPQAFPKFFIELIGSQPTEQAWQLGVLADRGSALSAPLRLEIVECCFPSEDTVLRQILDGVLGSDYQGHGPVPRSRLLKALARDQAKLHPRILQSAQDRFEFAETRRGAFAILSERGTWDPLFALLKNEPAGEGLRMLCEALAKVEDPAAQDAIADALRNRIAQAVKAIEARAIDAELEQELLVVLQGTLVQLDKLEGQDFDLLLYGPARQVRKSGLSRMQGNGTVERWPAEIGLLASLARRDRLMDLIEARPELFLSLPGPLLARMALACQKALGAKAHARGADWLARLAEVALLGEAPGPEWMRSRVTVETLRFRMAWQARDWDRARWYALVLRQRYGSGGATRRLLEPQFGWTDWRAGRDPLARLWAYWWQASAYANLPDDPIQARAYVGMAKPWTLLSTRAAQEQQRLEKKL